MADFTITLDTKDLEKTLESLGDQFEAEMEAFVSGVANGTYAHIVSNVQSRIGSNYQRQEYMKALDFQQDGPTSYTISLGEAAESLEEGYPGYDMRSTLLNSSKVVAVGSRSGEPWVQHNQAGGRFAHVPFSHSPSKKSGSNLSSDINKLLVTNAQGIKQRITKTFRDEGGHPLSGKVAVAKNTGSKKLEGLVKGQHVYPSKAVGTSYTTFRTISDSTGSGWKHPGFEGLGLFEEANKWLEEQLESGFKTAFS